MAKFAKLNKGQPQVAPKRAEEPLAKCTPNYSNDTWWLQSGKNPNRQADFIILIAISKLSSIIFLLSAAQLSLWVVLILLLSHVWRNVVKQLVQHDWVFPLSPGNTLRMLDIGVIT